MSHICPSRYGKIKKIRFQEGESSMPENVIKFIEFWNELRNIYMKEYPEEYKKYDFPDGETFLAIPVRVDGTCNDIKEAVEKSCVALDTYENIKNIIRSGKLDHKIDPEDKKLILEDNWGKQFADIAEEWFGEAYAFSDNYYEVEENADRFVKAVKDVKKEERKRVRKQESEKEELEKEARRLEEQKKAEEEAEKKRQAEFEKRFEEEDKADKKEARERHEEQKELKYLKEQVDKNSKGVRAYLKYESEVAVKEAEREKKRAAKLEAEKNWSEEYREEVKRRREIYHQRLEREKKEREERDKREREEEEERARKEAEKKVQEYEKLKSELKDWLSDKNTSLSEIKNEMEDAQKQYEQNPEGALEWAETLAKTSARILGIRSYTRFGYWMQADREKLEYAAIHMPTKESMDEFETLIEQRTSWEKENDRLSRAIDQEIQKLPQYMQDFVKDERLDLVEDAHDRRADREQHKAVRDKNREERLKTVTEKYQKEVEEKRKAEEAERKRLEEEAEKKRLAEEAAAEKKRQEEEAERKRREEAAAAEKKRLEEEAERQRIAKEEEERKRLAQERDTRKEIFAAYRAVKDTKDRNILKKHTKFANMMGWLQTYENAFTEEKEDGAIRMPAVDKQKFADEAYAACLDYLKSHLETGKNGSSLDGQGTTEGILRKQAVVQILENMKKLPEFKDKPELQDIVELQEMAQEEKQKQDKHQRERINFDQLKSSLASKSKINRQQPYADLEDRKNQIKNKGMKK